MRIRCFARRLFLIIMTFIFSVFVACKNERVNDVKTTEGMLQGIIVDNINSLENILTKTYERQQLESFFGKLPPNERCKYESLENIGIDIKYTHEIFPIQCLRMKSETCCYSVYEVSEGGYYYVFWAESLKSLSNMGSDRSSNRYMPYFTAYISDLKSERDFDCLKEGISTAEDVSLIDPALELSFLISSGICSYSLLESGAVMEIEYENNECIKSRKDLIVKNKNIISKAEAQTVSYIASISVKDLP